MEKQRGILSAIILAFILLLGSGLFFWKAGFFEKRTPASCSMEFIQLCITEDLCKSSSLYWWGDACHLDEESKPKPSEYPDYDSLATMRSFPLVENFESYTPDGKRIDNKTFFGVILRSGKISKGYLEIVVSINNKPLTAWESIYFKASYNVADHYKYGGHLFRPDSLKVPPGNETHLLFPLNNISFLPNLPYLESSKPNTFNLFKLINNNKEVKFLTFISSLNPAKINSIKIYYECDKDVDDGVCELK
jgi:hypothetical protein